MKEEHEPRQERSTNDRPEDPLATSLTDLIDEMDRAAFRRVLAGRDVTRQLEINSHNVQQAQPKR
jgi:hypothetical protein